MSTPHAGILTSRCQANQTVRESTCITVYCKFRIAAAEYNSTTVKAQIEWIAMNLKDSRSKMRQARDFWSTMNQARCYSERNVPSTGGGTLFAQASATKLATQQRGATRTDNFSTIITLIHFITSSTVKRITSITHSYFMIGLKLVTPVTRLADV
jgi:hypothetical protein